MSWLSRKRMFTGSLVLFLFAATASVVGYRFADRHVRYITGGQPGPVNCFPCHAHLKKNPVFSFFLDEDYLSPLDLAISPDGRRLYVTAEDGNALLEVSATDGKIVRRIRTGDRPHSIVLTQDGRTGFVSNRWSNTIAVIDMENFSITGTLRPGSGPAGMTLDRQGKTLFVANSESNDISVIDLESRREVRRLVAGRDPCAMALSADGREIYVTNRITNPVSPRVPPETEVTVIDAGAQRVIRRPIFRSAHVIEGIASAPQGDLIFVTLTRPKNLLPASQVARGWMMNFGLGILDTRAPQSPVQILLDDVNACFADPYAVVFSPDGQRAFVSQSGADCISVIDVQALRELLRKTPATRRARFATDLGLSSRYVIKRIATGANPKGLVLSPDGHRLYVAERLDDRISVIDTGTLEVVLRMPLGRRRKRSMVRRGQQLFNKAGHAFQGQFSCRSCHPDGHQDGLVYDFSPDGLGRNLVNTLSLRELGPTSPYKWNGKNVSLYMQCGIRFAKYLTRTDPFPPDELHDLVAYILSIQNPPNPYRHDQQVLTPAQVRGKAIFERTQDNNGRPIPETNRCITCHPPPYFTNNGSADVGTLAATDSPKAFDVPHLYNLYDSAPYLHDGRAATLEEIWTKYNPDDKHGVASDLTKRQLNDLIAYLNVLGTNRK